MFVPLSEPDITEAEIEAVVSVLRGTRLSLGPKMEEFEQRVAESVGVPHGIAVSSGTAGLHLCVRALGIGAGDEVIVPAFTFIAAANACRYEGAQPVFVDIDAETLNMDPACVEAAITPRTRAIMAVHTFGVPAQMDVILRIADRHGLYVIEDACEALGSSYQGRQVGSFGHAAVFAFYPNKQITTGEGGMVVTRDPLLAGAIRAMRNQGRYPSDSWHQHSVLGFNYRLSEINCALGCVQMERLPEILRKRTDVARMYDRVLGSIEGITLPPRPTLEEEMSWFVYVVRVAAERDRIATELQENGVECSRYFAPIHQQGAYAGWPLPHPLPVTEAESTKTLALPFFNALSEEKLRDVADMLRDAQPATHDGHMCAKARQ